MEFFYKLKQTKDIRES